MTNSVSDHWLGGFVILFFFPLCHYGFRFVMTFVLSVLSVLSVILSSVPLSLYSFVFSVFICHSV